MDEDYNHQFEEVYELHAKAIFRFIFFRVSDRGLAEDIAHDAFVQFWRTLIGREEIKNARALLYTIAHGLIVDHYRKKKHRMQIPLDINEIDSRLIVEADTMEGAITAKDELANLFAKLGEIKQEYRDVLLMHYVDDLAVPEIAAMLRKNENAVRVLIHRALKALKSKL